MTRASLKRYWTARGVIPRWQLVLVYGLIAGSGMIGFSITRHQADRTADVVKQNHALALAGKRAAQQAKALTATIQRQRREVCKDQNRRRRQTIRALDKQIAKLPPAERARAKARRRGTVALINTLAPRRHCAAITQEVRHHDRP